MSRARARALLSPSVAATPPGTRRRSGTRNAPRFSTIRPSTPIQSRALPSSDRRAVGEPPGEDEDEGQHGGGEVQQAVPDGEPPRPPLAQPQRVGHHGDDHEVEDDVDRRPGQPGHGAERPASGEEQHDELGQADRDQPAEGEHAGLPAGARPEPRFDAEQPLPDEEPDPDGDRVGDVGERALEQERDGDVEPQPRPHPQSPGRPQRRRGHREDGERAGGEADVADSREGDRPRPRRRRQRPDEQRRQQDAADLAGDGR